MLTITGTMDKTIWMTENKSLKLTRGTRVILTPIDDRVDKHDNIWYARPLDGIWHDGLERAEDECVLLAEGDVVIDDIPTAVVNAMNNKMEITNSKICKKLWIEYKNNFCTMSDFMKYYGFSRQKARLVITTGRYEMYLSMMKDHMEENVEDDFLDQDLNDIFEKFAQKHGLMVEQAREIYDCCHKDFMDLPSA